MNGLCSHCLEVECNCANSWQLQFSTSGEAPWLAYEQINRHRWVKALADLEPWRTRDSYEETYELWKARVALESARSMNHLSVHRIVNLVTGEYATFKRGSLRPDLDLHLPVEASA